MIRHRIGYVCKYHHFWTHQYEYSDAETQGGRGLIGRSGYRDMKPRMDSAVQQVRKDSQRVENEGIYNSIAAYVLSAQMCKA